jgi:phage tail-like protein
MVKPFRRSLVKAGVSSNNTTQPAFFFTVQFPDEVVKPERKPEIVFLEISGIATEITTETIEEGGLNSNIHFAAKSIKHGNLVCKSGLIARESYLADWLKTLQDDLFPLIEPKTILVQLKNDKGDVLSLWRFNDAYPGLKNRSSRPPAAGFLNIFTKFHFIGWQ